MKKYHYTGGGANRTPREVAKLQRKYELFDTKYLEKVFADFGGFKVTGFEKPKNVGLPHVTYIVHFSNSPDLVYRGNLGPTVPEIQLLKEKRVADLALKNKIPSNKILYVDISRRKYPFDYQIQEKLGGLDAEIEFNGTKADYDRYSFDLGRVIAKLEDIEMPGSGHFSEKSLRRGLPQGVYRTFDSYTYLQLAEQVETVTRAKLVSATTAKQILRIFKSSRQIMRKAKGSLVHYDLADHNIRYDPKTFKVIAIYDWEASIVGDSVLDLASSPTWKTLYPRQEKLIEGYLSLKPKPDYFEEKLNLYRLRTVVWKVDHNIKFNLLNPERIIRLQNALVPFGLKISA